MDIKTILLIGLALLVANAQNCQILNASEVDPSSFDDRTYVIGNFTEESTDVLVCQCPPDSVFLENETLCSCQLANQQYDGQSCSCLSGYKLVGSNCVHCPYPCFACNPDGSCQTCENGYRIVGSECVAFSSDVEGVELVDGEIAECPGGCLDCVDGVCGSCNVGYMLNGGGSSQFCAAC